MDEPKPDFSNRAYLLPNINPEGMRFGCLALAVTAAVAVASRWLPGLGWLVLPLGLLSWGVFLFFRDPDRYPPQDESLILSPADGRVCLIEECPFPDALGEMEAYRGKTYWRVSIFMSVFNVHVNRMPTAGEILKKEYIAAGKFFNASLDKASKENERCNYLVRHLSDRAIEQSSNRAIEQSSNRAIEQSSNRAIGQSSNRAIEQLREEDSNAQMLKRSNASPVYAVTQIAGLVARRIVPQVAEGDRKARAERFGLIRFGSRLDVYLPEGVKPLVRVGQTMVAGETALGKLEVRS